MYTKNLYIFTGFINKTVVDITEIALVANFSVKCYHFAFVIHYTSVPVINVTQHNIEKRLHVVIKIYSTANIYMSNTSNIMS